MVESPTYHLASEHRALDDHAWHERICSRRARHWQPTVHEQWARNPDPGSSLEHRTYRSIAISRAVYVSCAEDHPFPFFSPWEIRFVYVLISSNSSPAGMNRQIFGGMNNFFSMLQKSTFACSHSIGQITSVILMVSSWWTRRMKLSG